MLTDRTQARIIAVPLALLVAIPGEKILTDIDHDAPTLAPYMIIASALVALLLLACAANLVTPRYGYTGAASYWTANALLAASVGGGHHHLIAAAFLGALALVATTISLALRTNEGTEGSQ